MSAADQLKQAATAIFNQIRDRMTMLQAEYNDLQSWLAHKKTELDSQVDILSSAYQRALDFRPLLGEKLLCPRCWVVNGKEGEAGGHGDIFVAAPAAKVFRWRARCLSARTSRVWTTMSVAILCLGTFGLGGVVVGAAIVQNSR